MNQSIWLLLTIFMSTTFSAINARAELLPFYIGASTNDAAQGIALAQFDTKTGEINNIETVAVSANPTFLALHPNGRFLYAANESGAVAGEKVGGLSAFAVDAKTKKLTALNAVAQDGVLCFLSVDATGKFLLTASYTSGEFEIWALLENGEIGERVELIAPAPETVNDKPKTSNAHQFVLSPDNRFAFAVDLGLDKVFIYRFDEKTGHLAPADPPFARLAESAGPRHLAFGKDAKFAYVINEHGNTVTAFKRDGGALENLQTLPTLSEDYEGKSYTSEIETHPNGKFLYGSNRGRDSIAIFGIDEKSGQLKSLGEAPTGAWPRHFTIAPGGDWLLAANQNDSSITVFRLDAATGLLSKSALIENLPGQPACLLFPGGSTAAPE